MDLQKLLNEMTVDEKLAQMTQLVPQIITDKGEGVITGPMRNFGITKKENAPIVIGAFLYYCLIGSLPGKRFSAIASMTVATASSVYS